MRNFYKHTLYVFIVFIISASNGYAKKCKSCMTGSWDNPLTWTPSGVPACGDTVIIQAGNIVDVMIQEDYSGCASSMEIYIYGELDFFHGYKLKLSCGSYIIVYPGGVVQADVGLSNSNLIEICSVVEWNSNTILNGLACLPKSHPVCASILPVELTYFKAETCKFTEVCFNWETATEINNDHYEVERSVDGINFGTVLELNSKAPGGNSHYKISYIGIDESPVNGINYYRLKQVNTDHTSTYSKVISVHMLVENELQFLIFPNFNSGEFTAQITGLKKSENISVLLRDPNGSIVYKGLHHVDEGMCKIKIVPEIQLHSDSYYCSFIIGDIEHIVKVIVEN
jgi:hypothetical protein